MDDIAALRAELDRLQARVVELERERSTEERHIDPESRSSRRGALKLAAGAAVGAVAGAVGGAQPAAAADLVLGMTNIASGNPTQLNYTGTGKMGLLVQSGSQFGAAASNHPAALGGWATDDDQPNGVYAYSNRAAGTALVATGAGSTATAILAESDSTPTALIRTNSNSTSARALRVEGNNGVGISAFGRSVCASLFSLAPDAIGAAIVAGRYGVQAEGGKAALRLLSPVGFTQAPPDRFDAHNRGEIDIDDFGDFWACVASGTPGTWRKLAGPDTAGAFHALDRPVRMFDSRTSGFPNSGRLGRNQARVISVADGRNPDGAVITPNAVPEGATAIAFNLTVDQTGPSNFLAVVPGDAGGFNTSSINWTSSNSAVANGLIVGINADREIKVFCGNGTGGTHFLIDVNGYWR